MDSSLSSGNTSKVETFPSCLWQSSGILCSVYETAKALTPSIKKLKGGKYWEAQLSVWFPTVIWTGWGIRFQVLNSNTRVLLLIEPPGRNQRASENEMALLEEGHLVLMKKINKWVIVSCLQKGHFSDLVNRSYEQILLNFLVFFVNHLSQ
jgi:hypothetical protein